jgi:hypothetical protein
MGQTLGWAPTWQEQLQSLPAAGAKQYMAGQGGLSEGGGFGMQMGRQPGAFQRQFERPMQDEGRDQSMQFLSQFLKTPLNWGGSGPIAGSTVPGLIQQPTPPPAVTQALSQAGEKFGATTGSTFANPYPLEQGTTPIAQAYQKAGLVAPPVTLAQPPAPVAPSVQQGLSSGIDPLVALLKYGQQQGGY